MNAPTSAGARARSSAPSGRETAFWSSAAALVALTGLSGIDLGGAWDPWAMHPGVRRVLDSAVVGGAVAVAGLGRPRVAARHDRQRPDTAWDLLLGISFGVLGTWAAWVLSAWVGAAWGAHPQVPRLVGAAVSGVALGAGSSTRAGSRAALTLAAAGGVLLCALSLAASAGTGLPEPLRPWPVGVAAAAFLGLATCRAPTSALVLLVLDGARTGHRVLLDGDTVHVGSHKRVSDVFLPPSDGVAARHLALRHTRAGWVAVRLAGPGFGVSVIRHLTTVDLIEGAAETVGPGDRIALSGPDGGVQIALDGRT